MALRTGNYRGLAILLVKQLERAALRGVVEAAYRLGSLYSGDSELVAADRTEAYRWFALAASVGMIEAADKLSDATLTVTESERAPLDAWVDEALSDNEFEF